MDEKKWALVTGASGGVGYELACILAEKNWNLVLAARNTAKLQSLAEKLLRNAVSIEVCTVDLSQPGAAKNVFDFCVQKKLTIDLLINNAGAGLFGESVELASASVPLLSLNIIALTELCALFGKEMKMRKTGSILNIGSIAGNQPTPFFASYAASKSYVLHYSLALRHELVPFNVNVTCVQPGYIQTAFDDNCNITSTSYKRFSERNSMTARQVALICISSVFKKRSFVRAGIVNKITAFFTGFVPKNFLAWVLYKSILNMTKDAK